MYAEDILNKRSGEQKETTITDITRGTVAGATIGLIGGVLYAFFKEKKYVTCMVIGAIGGGLISRIFLIRK